MPFQKNDSEKPPVALIPPLALLEIAKGMQIGAENYDKDNYLNGSDYRRYISAAQRHILKWSAGETDNVEVTKLGNTYQINHLAQAAASILIVLEQQLLGIGNDDRPKQYQSTQLAQKALPVGQTNKFNLDIIKFPD